jgi:DNA polymerase elongation subunit (family B)
MYKIEFDKYDYIFKDFVEYFEKMRMMGGSYKTLSKLIVNSLYGRFGMSDEIDCSFFISKKVYETINQKIEIKSLKNINDLYLITCEINKKNKRILKEFDLTIYDDKTKSNVVLASCITSKARIKLYKSFLEVIKSGGRVLYCDTDSIFASYYKNMDNKKIGEIY